MTNKDMIGKNPPPLPPRQGDSRATDRSMRGEPPRPTEDGRDISDSNSLKPETDEPRTGLKKSPGEPGSRESGRDH